MIIELMQRTERDWAVYVDRAYAGTISKIHGEFVCTHTSQRFDTQEAAEDFLVAHERKIADRVTIYA